MSWKISLIDNEPNISEECAKELFETHLCEGQEYGDIWSELEDVCYEGKLRFNSDHMEWMDFLGNNEDLLEILKKHKVKGDITFANVEGDNSPDFWGYRFDGKGNCFELVGKLQFEIDK